MLRIAAAWIVLLAVACGGGNGTPAPGDVLSRRVIDVPPGTSITEACTEQCFADAGDGCFQCTSTTLPDGGSAGLCETLECVPAPRNPPPT